MVRDRNPLKRNRALWAPLIRKLLFYISTSNLRMEWKEIGPFAPPVIRKLLFYTWTLNLRVEWKETGPFRAPLIRKLLFYTWAPNLRVEWEETGSLRALNFYFILGLQTWGWNEKKQGPSGPPLIRKFLFYAGTINLMVEWKETGSLRALNFHFMRTLNLMVEWKEIGPLRVPTY